MSRFQRLRTHPLFARWFAHVHPFFWPVLWWQIERTIKWMKSAGYENVLISIEWWGAVRIVRSGDKTPDPDAYRPIPRTFRPLTDERWGSDMPVTLQISNVVAATRDALLLHRAAGEGGWTRSVQTEGALPSPPNTS